MFLRIGRLRAVQLAALAALLVTAGCEDDDSPTSPTPVAGNTTPNPGTGTPATGNATQVQGHERMAWHQSGDVSKMTFRAYVDGKGFNLSAAKCDNAKPDAECESPLPSLSDGVHTVE